MIYSRNPNALAPVNEAWFTAEGFRNMETGYEIFQFSEIQPYNYIEVSVKYRKSLSKIFTILKTRVQNLKPKMVQYYADQGLKSTMPPEWYVRSMLVFGYKSTFPIFNKSSFGQKYSVNALRKARTNVPNIRGYQLVQQAIQHNISPPALSEPESGDKVYAYGKPRKK